MNRNDFFTKEKALAKTHGGRDIFEHILGSIPTRNISSPLRPGDSIPSFSITSKNGVYYFHDFGGNQSSGNALDFLMELNGWTFGQTLSYIKDDFYGFPSKAPLEIAEKEEILIEYEVCKFQDEHKKYWDKYELDEKFLNDNDVYAAKKVAYNKKVYHPLKGNSLMIYEAPDIKKCKILQIGENVPPEEKWKNSVPNNYLWWAYKYTEKCDFLFVCKSVKDALVLRKLGYCTIATQNESSKTLLLNNVNRIREISDFPIIVYGTDKQGKQASIEITNETGWAWFNTKNYLYSNYKIEDPADLVADFGSGILRKEIENKLKIWTKK